MLRIHIPKTEYFDERDNTFVDVPSAVLELEHSLVSLSKWESIYEIPFLSTVDKTDSQLIGYIKAMTLNDVAEEVYFRLTTDETDQINKYINAKMTATWFSNTNQRPSREIITSEVIYYWMISLNIPMECETWHLNRLLTLIQVCNQKNAPKKKLSRAEIAQRNRQLNEQRRKQLNTSG